MLSTTIFGWFPMPTTLPLSDDTLRLNSTLSHPAILAGAGAGGQPRLVHLLLEVSGGSQGESLPMNLGLVVDVSESMHIRLVSDVQFRELASQGLAQEIITDGVPAWQINSAPPDLVNQLPRRIDYLRTALVKMADYLSAADRFSLVALRSSCLPSVVRNVTACSRLPAVWNTIAWEMAPKWTRACAWDWRSCNDYQKQMMERHAPAV
jgi:hypothetical protein